MENRLSKYKPYFSTGLWHVHTTYTDGQNSVEEYCQFARKWNIPLIAFTEHIRFNPTYNFNDFSADIVRSRIKYPDLKLLIGCETKILDLDGNIDVSTEVLSQCDIVMGVFHSFPYTDKPHYLFALSNLLKNQKIDLWGHPTLFQKRKIELSLEEMSDILTVCEKQNIYIEWNLKYDLPDERFRSIASQKNIPIIIGRDTHNLKHLEKELSRG